MSNSADTNLAKNFKPDIIIVDEAGQASELESFLPWAHNTNQDLSTFVIFSGDPAQLPPTVKTYKKMKTVDGEERPINPYADSMKMSHMQRLLQVGHPTLLLKTQYRTAASLADVYSTIFYGGKFKDGLGTGLVDRPKAREAINFTRTPHHQHNGIPHILLNVPGGTSH